MSTQINEETPKARTKEEVEQYKKEKNFEKFWEKEKKEREQQKRIVKERMEQNEIRREKNYLERTKKIKESDELNDNINTMLDHYDDKRQERLEKMYNKWHENVFDKLQSTIDNEINKTSANEMCNKRNEYYDEFLKNCNEKGGVYLDNYDDDYNPLLDTKSLTIKAKTNRLNDPALQLTRKHDDEERLLNPNISNKIEPKEMLNPIMWASGKIESTPHGRYAHFMNKPSNNSENRNARNRTTFKLDHFNYPTGKEVVDKEFHKPIRTIAQIREQQGVPSLPPLGEKKYVTNYLTTTQISYGKN